MTCRKEVDSVDQLDFVEDSEGLRIILGQTLSSLESRSRVQICNTFIKKNLFKNDYKFHVL